MAELALYEVQHRNITTHMKLTEEEAEVYGDLAKKVGNVKPAERQPITQPPWATEHSAKASEATPAQDDPAVKRAPARRNKRSTMAEDK